MRGRFTLLLVVLAGASPAVAASDFDEFKVKRREEFRFASAPTARWQGPKLVIGFETRGLCDVSVAVEDREGRILRHLACGVLGAKAPEPLQKGSRKQTLVWDGKDDAGRYVDDLAGAQVRVSLGLKPSFEKTLYWSPHRRFGFQKQFPVAAPEGVYVYDGRGFDHVRLFDHEGNYLRTVYPFPAAKVASAKGLLWHTYPQDGRKLPLKINFNQATMLTSGRNGYLLTYKAEEKRYRSPVGTDYHQIMDGAAATVMAVRAGRIALAYRKLNRLATDGTTGGLPLTGPRIAPTAVDRGNLRRGQTIHVAPRSAALDPTGRWMYLTGYVFGQMYRATKDIQGIRTFETYPGVYRLDVTSDDPPTVFAGDMKRLSKGGSATVLKSPVSIACDEAGRVYVADYAANRVQIFSPKGGLLKTIATPLPAQVCVHRKTGEIYVFSWHIRNEFDLWQAKPTLTRFGPFAKPERIESWPLKGFPPNRSAYRVSGFPYYAEIDSWREPLTVWASAEWGLENVLTRSKLARPGVVMYELRKGAFVPAREFAADARKTVLTLEPPRNARQRLYVNPADGMLYVSEADAGVGKSFTFVARIDPATGKTKRVELPFDAEDMAFSKDGLVYLRTENEIARYNPRTWREVPWDYGEHHDKVGFSSSRDGRPAEVTSVLSVPSNAFWHHGGMALSARGHLVISCYYEKDLPDRAGEAVLHKGKPYQPRMYPGRVPSSGRGGPIINIFDKHGQLIHEDAAPGLGDINGIYIDQADDIYLLSAATRILDGKRYFNDMSGTVIKFKPGKGRTISKKRDHMPLPLPPAKYPKRDPDLVSAPQGTAWVEGAEWLYGGVGWGGKNMGTGCACWNTRFAVDYFARSFAPEIDRYSVAVLDAAGNVILRVGRYGNVDNGKPADPAGGPPKPQAIGGDEVALFYPAYLAVDTDRRLFIADPGNARIVAVTLGYHTTRRVAIEKGE